MSMPGNNAEAQQTSADAAVPTFEQQVNTAVKQLSKDDKGVWQFPADLDVPSEVKFAATIEKRRRDTESALGKTQQQLKAEGIVREELEKQVAAQVQLTLSSEEAEELDDLMTSDPEAWRKKMNTLEQKATTALQENLTTIKTEATQQTEQDRRAQVLEQFNAEHTDAPITDESLVNDIPPRIAKKLEKGEVTFEEFLAESYSFLTAGKVVKDPKPTSVTNIGLAAGGNEASDEAQAAQELTDYDNAIF